MNYRFKLTLNIKTWWIRLCLNPEKKDENLFETPDEFFCIKGLNVRYSVECIAVADMTLALAVTIGPGIKWNDGYSMGMEHT